MKRSPFILRSEKIADVDAQLQRREAILNDLSVEERDQVSGGTNSTFDISPTWNNTRGGDHSTSNRDY